PNFYRSDVPTRALRSRDATDIDRYLDQAQPTINCRRGAKWPKTVREYLQIGIFQVVQERDAIRPAGSDGARRQVVPDGQIDVRSGVEVDRGLERIDKEVIDDPPVSRRRRDDDVTCAVWVGEGERIIQDAQSLDRAGINLDGPAVPMIVEDVVRHERIAGARNVVAVQVDAVVEVLIAGRHGRTAFFSWRKTANVMNDVPGDGDA